MKKTFLIFACIMASTGMAFAASIDAHAAASALAQAPALFNQAFSPEILGGLMGLAGITLAANQARVFEIGDLNDLPVVAADIIYQGSAVGVAAGYHRPLVAADPFAGFAEEKADNSAGAAGAINVHVRQRGRVSLAIAALAITDIGVLIYASDDNTFTKVAAGNTKIGKVVRFVSTGAGIVEFDVTKI